MTLKEALISSNGCTPSDAQEIIKEMRVRIMDGEDPDDVLYDWGLEPDYVMDLLYYETEIRLR